MVERAQDADYTQLVQEWASQTLPALPSSLQVIADTVSTTSLNEQDSEKEDEKLTLEQKRDQVWMEERYLLYYRDRFDASKLVATRVDKVQVPARVSMSASRKSATKVPTMTKNVEKRVVIAVLKKGARLFHGTVSQHVQRKRNSYFALWPGVGEMILAEKQLVTLEGTDGTNFAYKPAYMYEYEVKHDIYLEKVMGISLAHGFTPTPGLAVETVGLYGNASTLIPDIFGNYGTSTKEPLELDFPEFLHFIQADMSGLVRRTTVNNVEVFLEQPERDLLLIRKWNINTKTMLERWIDFFRDFQRHKQNNPGEMTERKIEEAKMMFAYGPRLKLGHLSSDDAGTARITVAKTSTRKTLLNETVETWTRLRDQVSETSQYISRLKETVAELETKQIKSSTKSDLLYKLPRDLMDMVMDTQSSRSLYTLGQTNSRLHAEVASYGLRRLTTLDVFHEMSNKIISVVPQVPKVNKLSLRYDLIPLNTQDGSTEMYDSATLSLAVLPLGELLNSMGTRIQTVQIKCGLFAGRCLLENSKVIHYPYPQITRLDVDSWTSMPSLEPYDFDKIAAFIGICPALHAIAITRMKCYRNEAVNDLLNHFRKYTEHTIKTTPGAYSVIQFDADVSYYEPEENYKYLLEVKREKEIQDDTKFHMDALEYVLEKKELYVRLKSAYHEFEAFVVERKADRQEDENLAHREVAVAIKRTSNLAPRMLASLSNLHVLSLTGSSFQMVTNSSICAAACLAGLPLRVIKLHIGTESGQVGWYHSLTAGETRFSREWQYIEIISGLSSDTENAKRLLEHCPNLLVIRPIKREPFIRDKQIVTNLEPDVEAIIKQRLIAWYKNFISDSQSTTALRSWPSALTQEIYDGVYTTLVNQCMPSETMLYL